MNKSSVLWSAVRNWGPRLGTILTFFVLARILDKSEIGVFAAATALIALTELFADNGFGDAVVRNREISNGIATTILLLNFGLAAAVYLLIVLFSSQIGAFLGIVGIGPILQLVGLSLVVNSFGYVPQALLRKSLQFKRLAFRSLSSTIAGAVVGIVMALTGFGVYSMVGQLLITAIINVIFLWYPRVLTVAYPELTGLNEIVPFALRIFGSRALTYLALRSIELVIPFLFGPAALALYILGSRVPAVLAQMLTAVMIDVNLPYFSRFADQPKELRRIYYQSLRSFSALSLPAFLAIAALAPQISAVAFGHNGTGVPNILAMMAILGAIQSLGYSNDVFLTAYGLPEVSLRIQVTAMSATLVCFLVFATAFNNVSVDYLVYTYVSCHCVVILSGLIYSTRKAGTSIHSLAAAFGPHLLSGCGAFAVVRITHQLFDMDGVPPLIIGSILGAIFAVTHIAILIIVDRQSFVDIFHQLRRKRLLGR
ncbi:hypothetical protein DTW90_36995 [Neorhizobium sp. P12A]|uniref:oligosaccharide flippase family protein n=1 Tax=Neorhizobium sp. P12A TaxID=2268027 RepID=UPI0011ECAF20|nr:oligosaccharide flippase family protein [Neorhizobium sp. P12A]KAA0681727.1 hypothetical protein DTW90_36995 [Neorhizobium sp. P12A]